MTQITRKQAIAATILFVIFCLILDLVLVQTPRDAAEIISYGSPSKDNKQVRINNYNKAYKDGYPSKDQTKWEANENTPYPIKHEDQTNPRNVQPIICNCKWLLHNGRPKVKISHRIVNNGQPTAVNNGLHVYRSGYKHNSITHEDQAIVNNEQPIVSENQSLDNIPQPVNKTGYIKRLPQCIIVGVRKAGTRALKDFLSVHPDIVVAKGEPHFFNQQREYEKGKMESSVFKQKILISRFKQCMKTDKNQFSFCLHLDSNRGSMVPSKSVNYMRFKSCSRRTFPL